jgi:hypothetical protein
VDHYKLIQDQSYTVMIKIQADATAMQDAQNESLCKNCRKEPKKPADPLPHPKIYPQPGLIPNLQSRDRETAPPTSTPLAPKRLGPVSSPVTSPPQKRSPDPTHTPAYPNRTPFAPILTHAQTHNDPLLLGPWLALRHRWPCVDGAGPQAFQGSPETLIE